MERSDGVWWRNYQDLYGELERASKWQLLDEYDTIILLSRSVLQVDIRRDRIIINNFKSDNILKKNYVNVVKITMSVIQYSDKKKILMTITKRSC